MLPTDVMLLNVKGPLRFSVVKLAAPPVKALVEVRLPTTVRDDIRTLCVKVDGKTACTPPTIAGLVELIDPTTVMLPIVTGPFIVKEVNVAAPATMALVDVMVPTTARDEIWTECRKVDGREATTPPTIAVLVEVMVPTEVMLLASK